MRDRHGSRPAPPQTRTAGLLAPCSVCCCGTRGSPRRSRVCALGSPSYGCGRGSGLGSLPPQFPFPPSVQGIAPPTPLVPQDCNAINAVRKPSSRFTSVARVEPNGPLGTVLQSVHKVSLSCTPPAHRTPAHPASDCPTAHTGGNVELRALSARPRGNAPLRKHEDDYHAWGGEVPESLTS